MKKTLRSFWRQAAALSMKQRSGLSLLLPCSAILSLAYGGYFLAGLHADTTETHPLIVAGQAVSRQVYGQSAAAPRAAVSDVVTKALAFKAAFELHAAGHARAGVYTRTRTQMVESAMCEHLPQRHRPGNPDTGSINRSARRH